MTSCEVVKKNKNAGTTDRYGHSEGYSEHSNDDGTYLNTIGVHVHVMTTC